MSAHNPTSHSTSTRPRTGWTVDAQGEPARLFSLMRAWLSNDFAVIGKEEQSQMFTEIHGCTPLTRRGVIYVLVMMVVVLGLVIGSLLTRSYSTGHPTIGSLISALLNPAILPAVVASFIPLYVARKQRLKKIESVLLDHGRCPHCGYRLSDISEASGDATTCPECAHGWHLAGQYNESPSHGGPSVSMHRRTSVMLLLVGLTALLVIATLVLVLR